MPSNAGWKTGEQLEYLLANWDDFKHAQNMKKLDPFWQRVFDGWHRLWPIPLPRSSHGGEPPENLRLMAQKATNVQIKTWFNNRGRGSDAAKSGRVELKLDTNEKRMLAPVQAYCTYAWESTLRSIVLARWEQQKATTMINDDDDPPEDRDSSEESHIPLRFKLDVAKEMYNQLPAEEKKAIDVRREQDRRKLYRTIPEIGEEEERVAKLGIHHRNQSHVNKSVLRVLKNLEHQTGSIAHIIVASVDPVSGAMGIQNYCQGKTDVGELNFEAHYGRDWEENVVQKFGDWASRIFGDVDSKRREMYVLPKKPVVSSGGSTDEPPPAASSSKSPSLSAASSKKSAPKKGKPQARQSTSPPQPLVSEEPTPQPSLLHAPSPNTAQPSDVSEALQHEPTSVLIPPAPSVSVVSSPSTGPLDANGASDIPPAATSLVVNQLLSQVASAAQPPSTITPENERSEPTRLITNTPRPDVNPSQPVVNPSQLVVVPSQLLAVPSQPVTNPPQPVANLPEPVINTPQPTISTPPQPATNNTNATTTSSAPGTRYRVRSPESAVSRLSSRRDSIDGAPAIAGILQADSGPEDTPEMTVDLSDYIDMASETEDSHVSSSQKTSDGCRDPLSPPPSSQWRCHGSSRTEGTPSRSGSSPIRDHTPLDVGELPSWMTKKGQWKYLASTAGGPAWERLLEVYMQQERRLEFTEMGATITHEDRPLKIKEYFQYAHQPSRGDNLVVPAFGEEVARWWKAIQPEWRHSAQDPSQTRTAWSYILSGGSKGVFLVIMCLAWWDRAHARYLDETKNACQAGTQAAGVAPNLGDLPDHDAEWLEIVKDVTFAMEQAQSCDIPVRGVPSPSRGTKRKREPEPTAPRKRSAARSAPSRR